MNEQEKNIFAERLRELRARHSMTQKEFGLQTGIAPATLSAYEKGTKTPVLSTAIQIAKQFNVSLDWLCGIQTNAKPQDGYMISFEEMLKCLVRILKTKWDITINHRTNHDGFALIPEDMLESCLYIPGGHIVRFVDTVKNLRDLNSDGTLDDEMFDACVKRACEKAVEEEQELNIKRKIEEQKYKEE